MCHLSCYPLKPHAQTPIFIPVTSCPINFPMHKFVSGSEFMVGVSGNRTACNYSKSHEAWDLTALHKVSLKFCLIIVGSILQAHHIHQSYPTFLALRPAMGEEEMALQERRASTHVCTAPFAQATGKHSHCSHNVVCAPSLALCASGDVHALAHHFGPIPKDHGLGVGEP